MVWNSAGPSATGPTTRSRPVLCPRHRPPRHRRPPPSRRPPPRGRLRRCCSGPGRRLRWRPWAAARRTRGRPPARRRMAKGPVAPAVAPAPSAARAAGAGAGGGAAAVATSVGAGSGAGGGTGEVGGTAQGATPMQRTPRSTHRRIWPIRMELRLGSWVLSVLRRGGRPWLQRRPQGGLLPLRQAHIHLASFLGRLASCQG
mmetsp:Transcript_148200/g.475981  ORF Transcript_148200/g.475981 Transcript_148200/m.475981 type:complete len:201 (-) Transcript_148200:3243-3845(-)